MRRGLILLLPPLSILLAAAGVITYFIWWDAKHCTFCRARLEGSGRCPDPDCRFGQLTREPSFEGSPAAS